MPVDRGRDGLLLPALQRPRGTLRLVQTLRFVAAMMVVLHHATIMVGTRIWTGFPVWHHGAAGVDIFFVISGLVMTLSAQPLLGQADGARRFFARRIERVVPLYWIMTTVKLLLLLAVPAFSVTGGSTLWQAVASYLFLPARGHFGYYPVLLVGWTLNFEMLFYVLFAMVLWRRLPQLPSVAVMLAVVSVGGLMRGGDAGVLMLLDPIVLEFLYGMLLGSMLLADRLPGLTLSLVLAAGGFTLLCTLPLNAARALLWGVPAMAIVAGALGLEQAAGRRVPRWLLRGGDASYSLYLTHALTLPALGAAAAHLNHPGIRFASLATAAALPVCVFVGALCYRTLEEPIMNFFKRSRTPETALAA